MRQPTNPPMWDADMMAQYANDMAIMQTAAPQRPVRPPDRVMTIRVGRPNACWIRRNLFEMKALGEITSFEESTGWLFRSFAVTGQLAVLERFAQFLAERMTDAKS